ncbi:FtsX-like permease family protein [Oleiagrimonas sp. C23AA]|uniref:ABC transporter permease n=1 Tax=Oleiagrimonas sp. C23AA TaxID=2719047 RepID=UPI00142084DE|nr:FtsX-like permease family protein [Oleiagrimonas sp. C23AA]NII12036.1 FtsX-like permease family protein [Oleiagrimonas sp. C23AA]
MHIRHILAALRHHRIAALLITLEIAFSCAVICNALFVISTRLERMHRPTGADETHLVEVRVGHVARRSAEATLAQTHTDLAALRRISGVSHVTLVNQTLFGSSISFSSVSLSSDSNAPSTAVTQYMADVNLIDTLGLKVVAGRGFRPDDQVTDASLNDKNPPQMPVIISQALAKHLFPGQSAVGKTLYAFGPNRIVGVVKRLVQPRDFGAPGEYEYAMVFPVDTPYPQGTYLLRVRDPAQRQQVIKQALSVLKKDGPLRLVSPKYARTTEAARAKYYSADRAMAWLLAGVCVLLLGVTALGIVGLTSFWVTQRRHQIGIRRAIGATRRDILTYFQTENFLIASAGIVLGMALAYGINLLLMQRYELPRLPFYYFPVGALVLWVLGQLSVLGAALRATHVPPVVATRAA